MTAPVVAPSTPVAPAAPVVEQPTLAQAVPQITPVIPKTEDQVVGLNALIKKVSQNSEVAKKLDAAEAAPAPVAETPVAPPTDAPPAEPQPVSVTADGELRVDGEDIKLRAERNADGTFKTQIDPSIKFDIEIKDPETGEPRKYTKSIPEILRMARDGVWGQKVKDEVAYYRAEVPKWEQSHKQVVQQAETFKQTASQLQEQLQAQMELNRELLTAPDEIVIRRREEYAHEMSPEQRLAKLQEQIAQQQRDFEARQQQSALAQQAGNFISTRLAPVLGKAEADLGGTEYAKQLVAGQIALYTTPLLQNGQLPQSAWSTVESYLQGPFQEWVRQTAAFQKSQTAAAETATEQVRKAQANAQAAINATGQVLRPVGSVSGSAGAAPQGPPKSMHDAMSRIINRPLSGAA